MKSKKNEKGVALLMVLTSITILTYVLADFTFGTKINKIRIQNSEDKAQARYNAQAGLLFAMSRLKIYKEAFNLLEKNKGLKERVGDANLEKIVTLPFSYPLPDIPDANSIQKGTITEFKEKIILRGRLTVTITPVSGFLNVNNLKIIRKTTNKETESPEEEKSSAEPLSETTEKKLVEILKETIDEKREKDEDFDLTYGALEPEILIGELKYYINNPTDYDESDKAQVDSNFLEANLIPKHAPLSSLEELYLLPSWNDEIVDLIKDRLSVHETAIIPLNKINADQLKVIFPSLTKDQITEFFKYRDGVPAENLLPHPFKSDKDFKEYIVNELEAVEDTTYQAAVKALENAGLSLGIVGKLFKVSSTGQFGRATFKITAFVDLPIKPPPKKKKPKSPPDPKAPVEESEDNSKKDKTPPPMEVRDPRIVEIKAG
ncbi:MAG: hypothetical protein ACHQYQ_04205 [Bacteriovoracales bacterium]